MFKKNVCHPKESIFVDENNPDANEARKINIKAILFKNREQALLELEKILKKNS